MKKCIVAVCAMTLALSLAACSQTKEAAEELEMTYTPSTAAASEETFNATGEADASAAMTVYGRVTEVNGANVTLQLGDMEEGGAPLGNPNGGNGRQQRADGENQPAREGQTRPADLTNEDGEALKNHQNNGAKPEGRERSVFVPGEESAVYDLSAAKIVVETIQTSNEGSLNDIAVDAILELELDGDGNVVSVNVRPMQGMGGAAGNGGARGGRMGTPGSNENSGD